MLLEVSRSGESLFNSRSGLLGSDFDLYRLALGVKMNILLFAPGLLVILFQYRGIGGMLESSAVISSIQVSLVHTSFTNRSPFMSANDIQLALATPFLSWSNPELSRSYVSSAYDFSRQFLYKWTVNWRFIDERTFLSKEFANFLLAAHVCPPHQPRPQPSYCNELSNDDSSQFGLLVIFALFKWLPPVGNGSVFQLIKKSVLHPLGPAYSPSSYPSDRTSSSPFSTDHIRPLLC